MGGMDFKVFNNYNFDNGSFCDCLCLVETDFSEDTNFISVKIQVQRSSLYSCNKVRYK